MTCGCIWIFAPKNGVVPAKETVHVSSFSLCTSFSGFASVSSVVPFFQLLLWPLFWLSLLRDTVVTTVLLPLAFLLLLSYDCNWTCRNALLCLVLPTIIIRTVYFPLVDFWRKQSFFHAWNKATVERQALQFFRLTSNYTVLHWKLFFLHPSCKDSRKAP